MQIYFCLLKRVYSIEIIRNAYDIHGTELMKLIFAVLDVLRMMGLTRCHIKRKVFYIF